MRTCVCDFVCVCMYALVERGGCFLSEEMRNARDAGDVYTYTSIHV